MVFSRGFRILTSLVMILAAVLMCEAADPFYGIYNQLIDGSSDPNPPAKPPPGDDLPGGDQAAPSDPEPAPTRKVTQTPEKTSSGLKPVCFLNTGTTAATVMSWTFIPAGSSSPEVPSSASTVAFPGGNPSACLSLPLGTYTWCYHWELGDVNGDGYIEYAHAIDAQPVMLEVEDTDDLDLAQKIVLVVPPGFKEYPGECALQGNMIAWGTASSEWRVELEGGIVVGGSAGGANYYTWTIQSGTFDGETLYFMATTSDVEGCKGQIEAWWNVTASTVSSIRVRDGCGTESTETHTFDRIE